VRSQMPYAERVADCKQNHSSGLAGCISEEILADIVGLLVGVAPADGERLENKIGRQHPAVLAGLDRRAERDDEANSAAIQLPGAR